MIVYDIEVTWLRDGKRIVLPATVCYREDEGPDSRDLRAEALRVAITEANPSDFPEDVEGAVFVGATLATIE